MVGNDKGFKANVLPTPARNLVWPKLHSEAVQRRHLVRKHISPYVLLQQTRPLRHPLTEPIDGRQWLPSSWPPTRQVMTSVVDSPQQQRQRQHNLDTMTMILPHCSCSTALAANSWGVLKKALRVFKNLQQSSTVFKSLQRFSTIFRGLQQSSRVFNSLQQSSRGFNNLPQRSLQQLSTVCTLSNMSQLFF